MRYKWVGDDDNLDDEYLTWMNKDIDISVFG